MKNYKVSLSRTYIVEVKAKDEKSAKEIAEFYLGHPKDISLEEDRKKENFEIGEIEMVMNDATEIIK